MAEHIYVGIWRDGQLSVVPVESVTDEILDGVDVLRSLRSVALPEPDLCAAARKVGSETCNLADPFTALWLDGHDCRGLELVRARVREALAAARAEPSR